MDGVVSAFGGAEMREINRKLALNAVINQCQEYLFAFDKVGRKLHRAFLYQAEISCKCDVPVRRCLISI
jgi:hypothetical protein